MLAMFILIGVLIVAFHGLMSFVIVTDTEKTKIVKVLCMGGILFSLSFCLSIGFIAAKVVLMLMQV